MAVQKVLASGKKVKDTGVLVAYHSPSFISYIYKKNKPKPWALRN